MDLETNGKGPGRTPDYYAEITDGLDGWNELIQEQLQRGVKRPKRMRVEVMKPSPPTLPLGYLGEARRLAEQILAMAKKCGLDRECWRREGERVLGDSGGSPTGASTPTS